MYIIVHEEDSGLFWSNEWQWVADKDEATVFDEDDRDELSVLPKHGKWEFYK